jgi:chemotaxis regulatin CheY-phosphate phosphatase CheZ
MRMGDAATPQPPLTAPHGRADVVADQGEVDNLRASLGF